MEYPRGAAELADGEHPPGPFGIFWRATTIEPTLSSGTGRGAGPRGFGQQGSCPLSGPSLRSIVESRAQSPIFQSFNSVPIGIRIRGAEAVPWRRGRSVARRPLGMGYGGDSYFVF